MLVLRSSGASPFGRKVKVAAAVLGLTDRITVAATDTLDPADSIRRQNPLGKIPALMLEDGTVLFDSRVILEYLDILAGGGRIIPAAPEPRFKVLRLQALADGLMDAGLLRLYEGRFRSADMHEPKWIAHQEGKMTRTLDALEADLPAPPSATPDAGQISLACALGWLDFRFGGTWRAGRPGLVAWYDRFQSAVPAFAATSPTA